jgi:protein-tyrosine phosphatase
VVFIFNKSLRLRKDPTQMSGTEILPNLWLTDKNVALDPNFIRLRRIQLVINCTKDVGIAKVSGIRTQRIPVNDSLQYHDVLSLYQYLPRITTIMGQAYQKRIPMLVHCYAGRQRAATVVASFLMRYMGMDWPNAVKTIQSKRPAAFRPGINFAQALKSWNQQYGSGRSDTLLGSN